MSKLAKALTAAAGNAGESLYVEDVFSTYLYEGNGSTQTITNGIDLAGEGGMVWTKERSPNSRNHFIGDSERNNFRNYLYPNLSNAESGLSGAGFDISSVSSTGYSLGADNYTWNNESGSDQVSWTFRKAEKFFDVVTYTGNGVAGRTVAHNLGSTPAVIIVKRLTGLNDWFVYHSSLGATKALKLNKTDDTAVNSVYWNDTEPTDSVFSVGTFSGVNTNTVPYVAYLFASDAGGFGDDGSESIIKCGSYTGNGGSLQDVNVGFEPQYLLVKNASAAADWWIVDAMRGFTVAGVNGAGLYANRTDAETTQSLWNVNATGFTVGAFNNVQGNASGNTYIYIAIRRPMKTPESGTEVFSPVTNTGTGSAANITTNFPVDLTIVRDRNNTDDDRNFVWDRLRGNSQRLTTQNTGAEQSATHVKFDYQDKIVTAGTSTWFSGASYIFWNFKRATGFFDVVAYDGDGVAGRTVNHSLGVAPELMIVKVRDSSTWGWAVYAKPLGTGILQLQDNGDYVSTADWFNNTHPTDSVFYVSDQARTNLSGGSLIAYLFATLAGVSKVGSYTGTGSTPLNVDCGFSSGARFVMIKRADGTGGWYVHDTERGIVAGNDPMLQLNSIAAEATTNDYIDPYPSGFTVSNTFTGYNASGSTYIFLAIA